MPQRDSSPSPRNSLRALRPRIFFYLLTFTLCTVHPPRGPSLHSIIRLSIAQQRKDNTMCINRAAYGGLGKVPRVFGFSEGCGEGNHDDDAATLSESVAFVRSRSPFVHRLTYQAPLGKYNGKRGLPWTCIPCWMLLNEPITVTSHPACGTGSWAGHGVRNTINLCTRCEKGALQWLTG